MLEKQFGVLLHAAGASPQEICMVSESFSSYGVKGLRDQARALRRRRKVSGVIDAIAALVDERISEPTGCGDQVRDPQDAVRKFVRALQDSPLGYDQEHFMLLCLDARAAPIEGVIITAIGTVSQVDVHPRDIMRHAVRLNARSIIIAHNHPSGEPGPSEADIALTKRIKGACEIIGISLLDHVVIGLRRECNASHYSFAGVGIL